MVNDDRKGDKYLEDEDTVIFWFFLIDLTKVSLLRQFQWS